MNINSTKSNGYIEIILYTNGEVWTNLLKKAEKSLFTNFELKGFRKGQVPENIAKTHIGSQKIQDTAVELLLDTKNNELMDILKNENIASKPRVTISKISDSEVEIKIKAALSPEVKIGSLKNLKTKLNIEKVTQQEIDKEISALDSFFKVLKSVSKDTKIENGMTVDLNFVGKVDGKEFEGGKAENHKLKIGSKSFIDNFEDQLIDSKIGDEKIVVVNFPKVYPVKELAGKQASFEVKINDVLVEEDISPEEMIIKLKQFGHDSKEKMIESMKNLLQERKADDAKNKFFIDVAKEISTLEDTKIILSPESILEEAQEQLKTFEQDLLKQGMKLNDYLEQVDKDIETFLKEDMSKAAETRILQGIIFAEIVKLLELKVDENDIENELIKISKNQNIDIEKVRKDISNEQLKNSLLFEKLIIALSSEKKG